MDSQSSDPVANTSTTLNCLMIVLLCLFVMLNALAVPNQPKQQQAMTSIAVRFPSRERLAANPQFSGAFNRDVAGVVSGNSMAERYSAVSGIAKGGDADVKSEGDNLRLTLSADLLFTPGDDQLVEGKLAFLNELVTEIAKHPLNAAIEVHTDNQSDPLARFPSLWTLSIERARALYKLFREYGIPEERITAAGYAQFRPAFSNETEEGRQKNRRIVIVLSPVKEEVQPAQEQR